MNYAQTAPPPMKAMQDRGPALTDLAGQIGKNLEEITNTLGILDNALFGPRPAVGETPGPSDGSLISALGNAAERSARLAKWASDLLNGVSDRPPTDQPDAKRYG